MSRDSFYRSRFSTEKNLLKSQIAINLEKSEAITMETISEVIPKFGCSYCGNCYPTMERLTEHLEEHENGSQRCQQCFMEFSNKYYLRAHLISIHHVDLDPKPAVQKSVSKFYKKFCCEECGKLYSTSLGLQGHIRMHLEGRLKCPHCPKDFSNKCSLVTHLAVTHQVAVDSKRFSKLVCKFCNRLFAQKNHLLYHLKRKHFGFETKEIEKELHHQCYFCYSKFWSDEDLQNHMTEHTGEMPFQCDDCAKRFSTKLELTAHKISQNQYKKM